MPKKFRAQSQSGTHLPSAQRKAFAGLRIADSDHFTDAGIVDIMPKSPEDLLREEISELRIQLKNNPNNWEAIALLSELSDQLDLLRGGIEGDLFSKLSQSKEIRS